MRFMKILSTCSFKNIEQYQKECSIEQTIQNILTLMTQSIFSFNLQFMQCEGKYKSPESGPLQAW